MQQQTDRPDPSPADFEQALEQLEQVVQRMEGGEQSLDAALADFEKGISLVRSCRDGLDKAQQRVQVLLGEGPDAALRDLDSLDGGDDG